MAKPRRVDRPIQKNISLPESLVAEVDLLLFSEAEGRVPFGAWGKFVEDSIRMRLKKEGAQ